MARIVFVEDDPSIQKLIRVCLRDSRHSILMAQDGLEGLELIRGERPDVVFTDILMPGMDGLELCRALRSDPSFRDTPIILFSASIRRMEEGSGCGATDHLLKPFTKEELRLKLERHAGPEPA